MIQLSEDTDLPLYQRIVEGIRQAIELGSLQPGQKLPARQTLARQLGVNMVTVRHAYDLLRQEGLLTCRQGRGTFVGADVTQRGSEQIGRRYRSITVIVGKPALADCGREMSYVLSDILAGVSEALGLDSPAYRFAASLDRESLGHLTEHDAVLVKHAAESDLEMVSELASRDIPLLGLLGGITLPIPTVDYDHWHASSLAPAYLIGRGYTRLGYIGSKGDSLALGVKFFGFVNVHHEAGLDYQANHVFAVRTLVPGLAYSAASKLIQSGDLPQALVVDSDMKAMEVVTALEDAGLRVPEDVAVIGYGDIPEISLISPKLTTVNTCRREVGREAGKLLAGWPASSENGKKVVSIKLNARLIERESVLELSKDATHAVDLEK